ncbi:MAG: molybdate ABC transporter permease subunit, partial [Myxococcota bacterium]
VGAGRGANRGAGVSVDPVAAVILSIEVATASTALSAIPAIAVGRWLAGHDGWARSVVSAVVLVPLVLPPVVTGLVLLDLFGRRGPLGAALASVGIHVTFSWVGAVIAATVVGFPLYVVSIRQAFEAIDPRYAEVAATLGDPPWTAFRRVSLPLAAPGIAAGAVLAFARALGEFGATVVLAGNVEGRTRTIALAVYALLDAPGSDPAVSWLVGASVVLALGSLLAYEALVRRQRRWRDG